MRYLFFIVIFLILTSCNREFENPYDELANIVWGLSNLTVADQTTESLMLSWDPPDENFDGYVIDRKLEDGDWQNMVADLNNNANSWQDNISGLIGKSIKYKIAAFAGSYFSEAQEISITTFDRPVVEKPIIDTAYITTITLFTVVTSDGGTGITNRWILYSNDMAFNLNVVTIPTNPIAGSIKTELSDLEPNTTYYFRSYAENEVGITESQTASVTTVNGLVDTRDGKIYKAVTVENQTWMAENLDYLYPTYSWGYINEDGDDYSPVYGRLYNYTILDKVCPEGWHLANDEEWMVLERYLGMTYEESIQFGERNSGEVGKKLKSANYHLYYNFESGPGSPRYGWSGNLGTDEIGFNMLPAGICLKGDNGIYFRSYKEAAYYLSFEPTTDSLVSRDFFGVSHAIIDGVYRRRVIPADGDIIGVSIRCIKDN